MLPLVLPALAAFDWAACVQQRAYAPPASVIEVNRVNVTAADASGIAAAVASGSSSWPSGIAWSPAGVVATALPGIFASAACADEFDELWLGSMAPAFATRGPQGAVDLQEFLETGLSNGFGMHASVLLAPANASFATHIHASLEYMYIFGGHFAEMRLVQTGAERADFLVPFTAAEKEAAMNASVALPSVPSQACSLFIEQGVGGTEVNEVGSAHISRSGTGGLAMLTFFAGLASHVGTDRPIEWREDPACGR